MKTSDTRHQTFLRIYFIMKTSEDRRFYSPALFLPDVYGLLLYVELGKGTKHIPIIINV